MTKQKGKAKNKLILLKNKIDKMYATPQAIKLDSAEARKIVALKMGALDDYLAARVLYNNDLLLQATILANTAIEKELKAYLMVRDQKIKFTHDIYEIFKSIKKFAPEFVDKLNEEYLEQVQKIYQARYSDTFPDGFNFIIIRKKYLAELDFTYDFLEPLSRISSSPTVVDETSYEELKKEKDSRLMLNNYLLNDITKKAFIEREDLVYEYRFVHGYQHLMLHYKTDNIKDDSKFKVEALAPIDDSSFKIFFYDPNK